MLEIQNLSCSYGKVEALKNINLSFEKGKFYAVVGKNGSGKSTLVRCIASLLKYRGEISLDGKDLLAYSVNERARKISFLPQSTNDVPFTVRELVSFSRQAFDEPKEKSFLFADDVIERMGLQKLADVRVDRLSGGQRRLSYFAMSLCQNAEILLLDEPTNSLDAEHEKLLLDNAKKCTADGKTVLCVLHNLSDAVKYADSILVVENGNQTFFSDKEKCLEQKIIEKSFGVRRFDCEDRVFFSV